MRATDRGSSLRRLAKTDGADAGGWGVFHTDWSGLDMLNPAVSSSPRGNGKAAGRGWPTPPKPEALRTRGGGGDAGTEASRKSIAVAMQVQALEGVPYIPLGRVPSPSSGPPRCKACSRGPQPSGTWLPFSR